MVVLSLIPEQHMHSKHSTDVHRMGEQTVISALMEYNDLNEKMENLT